MAKKVFIYVGAVVVVIAIGIAIGLLNSGGPVTTPAVTNDLETTTPEVSTSQNQTPPAMSARPLTNAVAVAPRPAPRVAPSVPPAMAVTPPRGTNDWEDTVDEILASEGDDADKTKQLLAMFPNLPEEGQVEVAQHLSNLLDDEDFAPLGEMLKNPKLSEEVHDVLIGDLLNRPNAAKLPLLLEVAKSPEHVKREEATELLELYLDENHGTNWVVWQQKIEGWLKQNPD